MVKIPSLGIGKAVVMCGTGDDRSVQPVTWADNLDPATQDWVALFRPGASNADYLGAPHFTGAVVDYGAMSFVIPAGVGSGGYELRLFSGKTSNRIAASPGFYVTGVVDPGDLSVYGSLTVTGGSFTAGGSVAFAWSTRVNPLSDPPTTNCVVVLRRAGTVLPIASKALPGTGGWESMTIPGDSGAGALELVLFLGTTLVNPSAPTNLALAVTPQVLQDLALPTATLTLSATSVVATAAGARLDATFGCSFPTALDQLMLFRLTPSLAVCDRQGTAGYARGTLFHMIDTTRFIDGTYVARYISALLGGWVIAETIPFTVTH